jgi:hypothetical protein
LERGPAGPRTEVHQKGKMMSKQDYEFEQAKKRKKKEEIQFRQNRRGKKDRFPQKAE